MDSLGLFYTMTANRKWESKRHDAFCFSQHSSRVASFKQHETGFNSPKYFHFHFQEMIYQIQTNQKRSGRAILKLRKNLREEMLLEVKEHFIMVQ